MYLARYAGLRMYDCINLEWDSILPNEFNDNGKNLLVYTHKKDRRLCVPMPPQITALMPQIIGQRNHERWVWRELQRRYTESPTLCSAKFRDYVKRSGLDNNKLCFHSLRVTYAFACRDAGLSTDHIRQLLTHLDAETTALYLGGPAKQYPHQPPEYAATPPVAAPGEQTSHQNEQE
jgi:integrase